MRRKDTPLEFILFPMMHVASPSFYAQVRRRLSGCDQIVAEGVRGRSRQLSAITLAYRFAPRWRRNGLEAQQTASLLPAGVPVVNPDVTAAEAVAELRRLPRWMYLMLLLVAPVMGLVLAVRGPRAFLRADLEVEDLPKTHRAEELAGHPLDEAMTTTRRDLLLLSALETIYAERHAEAITVAVLYGAGHIPGPPRLTNPVSFKRAEHPVRLMLRPLLLCPTAASQTYGLTDVCSPELGNAPGEVPVTAVRGEGIAGYHRVGRLVGQQNVGKIGQLLSDEAGQVPCDRQRVRAVHVHD
jgi:hypothetical protein